MRVLFVTHYGPSHVPWLVPLAWACQLAGHDVRMATQTQSVPAVLSAGLLSVPLGDDSVAHRADALPGLGKPLPDRLAKGWGDRPEVLDADMLAALANRLFVVADAVSDDLVAFARAWRPDLVVHDTGSVAALVAAVAVKAPAVGHFHGVPGGMAIQHEAEVTPGYRALFERHGLDPYVAPAVWVDPCPPKLQRQDPIARKPMRFIPFSGSAALPSWLLSYTGRPRICVTGGMVTDTLDSLLPTVVEALRPTGFEVVLAVNAAQGEQIERSVELPDTFRTAVGLPLNSLLPTCDAILHHGGGGTTMISVASGLPQVILPGTPLQHDWARRVSDAGAGLWLETQDHDQPSSIRQAVQSALAVPSYQRNAEQLEADVAAMPTPADVSAFLEKLSKTTEHPSC